jgi:hypothetical protein
MKIVFLVLYWHLFSLEAELTAYWLVFGNMEYCDFFFEKVEYCYIFIN